MPPKDPYKVPNKMQAKVDDINALTDEICEQKLNAEYAELVRRATAALARKRPSPLAQGWAKTWACAVVYAVGQVNFLFDKTQTPHMRGDELATAFGISKSTASSKAKVVRAALKMDYFNSEWMLPGRIDSSPMIWIISVNGLMVDARHMPREDQEIAYEKGLIPYIPGER